MHINRCLKIMGVALLILPSMGLPGSVAAVTSYTVTDIGWLVGSGNAKFDVLTKVAPCEINNSGDIVSNSTPEVLTTFWAAPFTTIDGEVKRLGSQSEFTYVVDMNDSGDIVGYSTSLEDKQFQVTTPTVWRKQIELPKLSDGGAIAAAINDAGDIAGYARLTSGVDAEIHAVLWKDGEVADLGTLGGPSSHASELSEGGVVVGSSDVEDREGLFPFIWQDGKMSELELPEGMNGIASIVNDDGTIVGHMYEESFALHAVRWVDGKPKELPGLVEGAVTLAFDMNASGLLVGWSAASAGDSPDYSAVLWDGDTILDLNVAIPVDSGYRLISGASINDNGQILATGITADGFQHGVLLDPVVGSAGGSPAATSMLQGDLSGSHDVYNRRRMNNWRY